LKIKTTKKISFYIKKIIPALLIIVGGIYFINKGFLKWSIIKPYVNGVISYEFRVELVWFINMLIGISHYYFVGKRKQESKYVIIETSFPFIDSLLSVLTYGTIINSCFFLANEIVNGDLIGLNLDWLSLFISVFIILYWSIKRLFDMGKQTWNSYMDFTRDELKSIETVLFDKIRYKESNESLYITFGNGSEYKYNPVPINIYNEFDKSESKGKYFHDYIKGKFNYNKLT